MGLVDLTIGAVKMRYAATDHERKPVSGSERIYFAILFLDLFLFFIFDRECIRGRILVWCEVILYF